jgi:hypothetical protein
MAASRCNDDQVPTAIGYFLPIYLSVKNFLRRAQRDQISDKDLSA